MPIIIKNILNNINLVKDYLKYFKLFYVEQFFYYIIIIIIKNNINVINIYLRMFYVEHSFLNC